MKRTTLGPWHEVEADRRRALQFTTAQSTSVMCRGVDPLLTADAHTTQSTEYEHVCVVVDQVVRPCLGHEGARVGGDDDCRGGGRKFSSATVMFCRYAEWTVNVTRSDGQCRGTEDTGEVWVIADDIPTLALRCKRRRRRRLQVMAAQSTSVLCQTVVTLLRSGY